MMYIVIPEKAMEDPQEFQDYTSAMVYLPTYDTLEEADKAARESARHWQESMVVKKLVTVSFHKGHR